MTVLDGDEITELEKISPTRVDGVDFPASGFPILMLKALGAEPARNAPEPGDAPQGDGVAKDWAAWDAAHPGSGKHRTRAPKKPKKPRASAFDRAKQTIADERAGKKPSKAALANAHKVHEEHEAHLAAEAARAKAKAAKKGTATVEMPVTVELPRDVSVSFSPADLAKLVAHKRQAQERELAKRDMDPDVGGGVDRDKIPDEDFAGPGRSFPVVKPGDVSDAASSLGRAKGGPAARAKIKARIIAIARRKGQAFVDELPEAWKDGSAEKAGAKGKGKGKAFPGAAPPFKADKDGDGEAHEGKDGNGEDAGDDAAEKAGKGTACKCGGMLAKGDKFCSQCGEPAGKAEKGKVPSPEDAAVAAAIDRAKDAIGDALDAQDEDPDKDTHPADRAVSAHLDEAKHAIGNADDAQDEDIEEDDPEEHAAAKAAAEPPAYHLARLHDATCAAYRHEDVVIAHPSAAKGIGALVDPAAFAAMTSAALADDGGTGSRAHEIPALSQAFAAAVTLKGLAAGGGLDEAMEGLRKAFSEYYPDAHPKPGAISPGEFRRPYVSAGHATQSAKPGQEPRVPMSANVPQPSDFRRPLITAGREAPSPGSDPHPNGLGKAGRTYYTNAARDSAAAALIGMHDWIAGHHPAACPMAGVHPMAGVTLEGEPGQPGSMGTSLTTATPVPAMFAATKDKASPQAVSPAAAQAVVTPAVTKAERKAVKAARKAEQMAGSQAAETAPAASPQSAPLIDPDLLKGILREAVAGELGAVTKTLGDLTTRIAELESAPDPAQMAPRSGTAIAKQSTGSPEVPAGGDGHAAERLARLVKRAKDPDGNVRAAAIGELMETAGREAAVQLLEAVH